MRFREYMGMSYEQASHQAVRLINRDGWFKSFDRLSDLRQIMLQHIEARQLQETAMEEAGTSTRDEIGGSI